MILNVVDHRKAVHRWKSIDAVLEPTWHDNRCADADKASPCDGELDYDSREGISVLEAIAWASALPYDVTIYFYDRGSHAAEAGSLSKLPKEREG